VKETEIPPKPPPRSVAVTRLDVGGATLLGGEIHRELICTRNAGDLAPTHDRPTRSECDRPACTSPITSKRVAAQRLEIGTIERQECDSPTVPTRRITNEA